MAVGFQLYLEEPPYLFHNFKSYAEILLAQFSVAILLSKWHFDYQVDQLFPFVHICIHYDTIMYFSLGMGKVILDIQGLRK